MHVILSSFPEKRHTLLPWDKKIMPVFQEERHVDFYWALQAVCEAEKEIKHLGRIVLPFIVTFP
jgi:hypothetical protein